MTLLVGANLESYTIIAADTRVSQVNHYEDGDHKIALCNFGPVTGSGYLNALNAVKNAMLKMDISHTDQFLEIVREKAIPLVNQLHNFNPLIKDNTCFLISYATQENGRLVFRLALIHPDWDHQLAIYKHSVLVGPSDLGEPDIEKYNDILRKNIRLCDPRLFADSKEDEYNANILQNVKVVAECFSQISMQSTYVSDDLDIAILLPNLEVFYIYGLANNIARGAISGKMISPEKETRLLSPDLLSKL